MGQRTGIQWADATFNPWWGCAKVSAGCTNCYAERDARRFGHDVWGVQGPRRFFGETHWREPLTWNARAQASGQPFRVFCSSMADVFEDRPDLAPERAKLWDLIEATPALTWMLLTKRPENAAGMAPWRGQWPGHIWFGFTGEDQSTLDARWAHAAKIPAAVHFVSAEPLLGPLDFECVTQPRDPRFYYNALSGQWSHYGEDGQPDVCEHWEEDTLDWVIVAGESGGPAERALVVPMGHSGLWGPKPEAARWVRDIHEQCELAGVPFFFKGWGGPRAGTGGRMHRGREWSEFPASCQPPAAS